MTYILKKWDSQRKNSSSAFALGTLALIHESIHGVEHWSLHMCKQPQAHQDYSVL